MELQGQQMKKSRENVPDMIAETGEVTLKCYAPIKNIDYV